MAAFDNFLERLIPDQGVRNMVKSFFSPEDESGSGKSGGVADKIDQLRKGGLGEQTKSWVGSGPNKSVTPEELKSAIDMNDLRKIAQKAGMSEDEMLQALASHLPEVVDKATPNGSMKDLHNLSSDTSSGRSPGMS
jgi:uncharacterized protein YidB (DUF937 family)